LDFRLSNEKIDIQLNIQLGMDNINKIFGLIGISGLIILITSSTYIPSTGGTIPQGMSPEAYSNQQQQMVYASIPFKITMVGIGIATAGFLTVAYRIHIYQRRKEEWRWIESQARLKREIPLRSSSQIQSQPRVQAQLQPKVQAQLQPKVQPKPILKVARSQVAPDPSETVNIMELKSPPSVKSLVGTPIDLENGPLHYPTLRKFEYPPPYDVLNKK
jgi:hypothetical protein